MKNAEKILEIEALTENLTKHLANNNLLKIKVLFFISQYENLSVGMIIDKLGIKKSNFALMARELEDAGLITTKQGEVDKRCRMMYLTPKGKEELSAYLQKLNNHFGEVDRSVENAIDCVTKFLNTKI